MADARVAVVIAAAASTLRAVRRSPRDRRTARALIAALGGLPWVLRERRVSPPHVEAAPRALEVRAAARPSR
jgi:hypothetical protein